MHGEEAIAPPCFVDEGPARGPGDELGSILLLQRRHLAPWQIPCVLLLMGFGLLRILLCGYVADGLSEYLCPFELFVWKVKKKKKTFAWFLEFSHKIEWISRAVDFFSLEKN